MRATISGLSAILCAGMLLGPVRADGQAAPAAPPAAMVGDLQLSFEFAGPVPAAPALPVALPAGCGALVPKPPVIVGKNGGVRDVVVQLFLAAGQQPPPFPAAPANGPFLNNKNCEFDPHVLHLQTGSRLTIGNADTIPHSASISTLVNPAIGPLIPAGAQMNVVFQKPERLPVRVTCGIHPWMSAHIVMTDHPWVGISDANGKVVIKNLPPGDYVFRAWHESCGYIQTPTQAGVAKAWPLGKFSAKINAGGNNLGTFQFK